MKESVYQRKIIKELEAEGYYCVKVIQCNKNGMPDIIALKPNEVKFIEVKGSKGVLSPLQEYRIDELNKKGFKTQIRYAPTTN